MLYRLLTVAALVAVFCSLSAGQVLYELVSPNQETNGHFGYSLDFAGDVNNDGSMDVIVGAHGEDVGTAFENAGRAHVFSGIDGALLLTLTSPNTQAEGHFGLAVLGNIDIDSDEHDDVLVGAPGEPSEMGIPEAGRVYAFCGVSGTVFAQLESPNPDACGDFGRSLSVLNDINADGRNEIIVGAPEEHLGTDEGRVYVISGVDWALIRTITSPNPEPFSWFGHSVAQLEDIDNDGLNEIIIGAPMETTGSVPYAWEDGRAYVFSGGSGALLHQLVSPNPCDEGWFGYSVSGIDDVDGDGSEDIVIGACHEGPPFYAGRSYVFSGATGTLIDSLHTLYPAMGESFGWSVSRAGDQDSDGIGDILIGARRGIWDNDHMGTLVIFRGSDRQVFHTQGSPNPEFDGEFGCSLAGGIDLNNDGFDDLIVGAPNEDPGSSPDDAGRAYVFSGFLIPVELAFFDAESTEQGVLIRWRTETENQCYGFHLYRHQESDDGRQRITAEIVPGGGTSAVPRDYSILDPITEPGSYYYWLEEIAEDGRRTEFGPVEVAIRPTRVMLAGPYPNPVRDNAELRLIVPEYVSCSVTLKLFDLQGRQIGCTMGRSNEDDLDIQWSASQTGATPGVYWWRLEHAGVEISKPMIVVEHARQ